MKKNISPKTSFLSLVTSGICSIRLAANLSAHIDSGDSFAIIWLSYNAASYRYSRIIEVIATFSENSPI